MDRVERVRSVLQGRRPDRPPVSFWCHFPSDQVYGPAAVDAHLKHLETYELDFLKVMNDNGYPSSTRIRSAADLASLNALRGDEPEFARQLDLLADLKRRLGGRVWMCTTLFNAWATLRRLIHPPTGHGPPNLDPGPDETGATIKRFLSEDAAALTQALRNIATSLRNFARRCIEAGADGVFLSVRDDWVDTPSEEPGLYDRLVRPTDLEIMAGAANGSFNVLHVCGRPVNLRRFAEYPVQVMNWADRAAGPAIADAIGWARPAICGGVDNLSTLPRGRPEDCEREVADALRQAGDRPIMIAPGCTYEPQAVADENLRAVCDAVRGSAAA
jgi:uroporphyrinogen decarboxylase